MTDLFGKEKGIFVPTGHMGNMLSLALSTSPNSYVLQGPRSHLYKIELGSQIHMGFKPLPLEEIDNIDETFDLLKIMKTLENDYDIDELAKSTKVIAFENTHNYNGGKIINTELIRNQIIPSIKNSHNFNHLKFHLDGSRVLNAAAALNVDPKSLVSPYDTVNVCLSKAIGAPCGSVVLLSEKDYLRGLQIRKTLGGAMRQSGFLAAPALVALEDWRERFIIDHDNAKLLAEGLSKINGLIVQTPDTNIVNIYLDETYVSNEMMDEFVKYLEESYKILVHAFDGNKYIRAVIHHQVSISQVLYSVKSFENTVNYFISKKNLK